MSLDVLLRSRRARAVTAGEAVSAYRAVTSPPSTPTEPGAFIEQQRGASFRAGEILDKGEKITNHVATACIVVGACTGLYLVYRMVSERMERDEKQVARLEKTIAKDPAAKEIQDAQTQTE